MSVCTGCLYRNDEGVTFCASCGTFLEWASEVASDEPAPAAAARPARRGAAPRPSPGPDRSDSRQEAVARRETSETTVDTTGLDAAAAALAVAAENLRRRAQANRRRREGLPAVDEAPPSRARPRTGPRSAAAGARAPARPRATPPPPDDEDVALGEEPPAQPAALLPLARSSPGPEQPRKAEPSDGSRLRRTVSEEDAEPHPGDVPCARCQTANAPSRYFCRRCGSPLRGDDARAAPVADVAPAPRRRWWHRLLWWRERDEGVPVTPATPPSWKERAVSVLPVVAVLGLVAAALGPCRDDIGARLEAARKRFSPRYEQVYPAKVEASSSVPGHPPEATTDRAPNTYWSEGGPTPGEQEELTFQFDRPVDLGRIGFINGAQAKPQDFLAQPRVRDVRVVLNTGKAASITLKDRDAFQTHALDERGVSSVQIQIVSVYLSPHGGTDASLGEVEFFTTS